jgi:hypothetical protein
MGGWVLFRASDLSTASRFYGGLLGRHGIGGIGFEIHSALNAGVLIALLTGCVLAVAPERLRLQIPDEVFETVRHAWSFCLLVLASIYVAAGVYSPFLYFRF